MKTNGNETSVEQILRPDRVPLNPVDKLRLENLILKIQQFNGRIEVINAQAATEMLRLEGMVADLRREYALPSDEFDFNFQELVFARRSAPTPQPSA